MEMVPKEYVEHYKCKMQLMKEYIDVFHAFK